MVEQVKARRRAKELAESGTPAIAVEAHPKPGGGWRVGGWPNQKGNEWIVISPNHSEVLDDGMSL